MMMSDEELDSTYEKIDKQIDKIYDGFHKDILKCFKICFCLTLFICGIVVLIIKVVL